MISGSSGTSLALAEAPSQLRGECVCSVLGASGAVMASKATLQGSESRGVISSWARLSSLLTVRGPCRCGVTSKAAAAAFLLRAAACACQLILQRSHGHLARQRRQPVIDGESSN